MLLIKIVGEDADVVDNSSYPNRPQWMRVLAMEILRGYILTCFFYPLTDRVFLGFATTLSSYGSFGIDMTPRTMDQKFLLLWWLL